MHAVAPESQATQPAAPLPLTPALASQPTQPAAPLPQAALVMHPDLLTRLRDSASDAELRHLSVNGVRNLAAARALSKQAWTQIFPGAPALALSFFYAVQDAGLHPPAPPPVAEPATPPRYRTPSPPRRVRRSPPPISPESAKQQPPRARRRPVIPEYPCAFPECERVWAPMGPSCPDDGDQWQECSHCQVFCVCPDHGEDGENCLSVHEQECDE